MMSKKKQTFDWKNVQKECETLLNSSFSPTQCYCEENVVRFLKVLDVHFKKEIETGYIQLFALFLSSEAEIIAIKQQKEVLNNLAFWDYHVIALLKMPNCTLCCDFDNCKGFTHIFTEYLQNCLLFDETDKDNLCEKGWALEELPIPILRLVPFDIMKEQFASNRSHMISNFADILVDNAEPSYYFPPPDSPSLSDGSIHFDCKCHICGQIVSEFLVVRKTDVALCRQCGADLMRKGYAFPVWPVRADHTLFYFVNMKAHRLPHLPSPGRLYSVPKLFQEFASTTSSF
eukprot:GCRY01005211.1.p1 GENE.GCRY01005211.1~~GCRY01005211.1.p1  ORF type:complete len:288 (-),score=58.17 GCRY01005211.1:602-1465(-)